MAFKNHNTNFEMQHKKNLIIFLVDDDALCLTLYAQFMKQQGYTQIHMFDNGEDCITSLQKIRPAVIFLDYNMDEMNGLDVLKAIRVIDPTIIVIFISGEQDKSVAADAIRQGAADFIVKSSINEERIREIMESLESRVPQVPEVVKETPSFLRRLFSN